MNNNIQNNDEEVIIPEGEISSTDTESVESIEDVQAEVTEGTDGESVSEEGATDDAGTEGSDDESEDATGSVSESEVEEAEDADAPAFYAGKKVVAAKQVEVNNKPLLEITTEDGVKYNVLPEDAPSNISSLYSL